MSPRFSSLLFILLLVVSEASFGANGF